MSRFSTPPRHLQQKREKRPGLAREEAIIQGILRNRSARIDSAEQVPELVGSTGSTGSSSPTLSNASLTLQDSPSARSHLRRSVNRTRGPLEPLPATVLTYAKDTASQHEQSRDVIRTGLRAKISNVEHTSPNGREQSPHSHSPKYKIFAGQTTLSDSLPCTTSPCIAAQGSAALGRPRSPPSVRDLSCSQVTVIGADTSTESLGISPRSKLTKTLLDIHADLVSTRKGIETMESRMEALESTATTNNALLQSNLLVTDSSEYVQLANKIEESIETRVPFQEGPGIWIFIPQRMQYALFALWIALLLELGLISVNTFVARSRMVWPT